MAHVIITEPRVVDASLAVIRAELDAIRITMDPVLGQQRASIDYARLLLDLMSARVTLASLQSQLFQAESNLSRTNALFAGKLVTEERFEETKNTRDALASQVRAQLELIARVEPGLKGITADGTDGKFASPEQALQAAIRVQEENLRLTEARLGPVPLLAPIDGVVSQVLRREGETVAAGEPIFQISAKGSTSVIGFLRQPINSVLQTGQPVRVQTRSMPRQSAIAKVSMVGGQLEPIFPTLLAAMHLPVASMPTEMGLRIHVTAPESLNLRPGEHVDIFMKE
jgi:multidrug resistance efflux pump